MIDGGGQHFRFQTLDDFRRSFRVRTPFDLQLKVMRSDAAFSFLVAHSPVYRTVHSQDYLIGRESGRRLSRASQLSIDNVAERLRARGASDAQARSSVFSGVGFVRQPCIRIRVAP